MNFPKDKMTSMSARLFHLALFFILLLFASGRLPAQEGGAESGSTLTKDQVDALVSLCAAQGRRQGLKPVIADFLGLSGNESGHNGYESANVKFRNGDECSFLQLGRRRNGYLFARIDAEDGYTYIFHLGPDLKRLAAMKIRIRVRDGRIVSSPVSLSREQADLEWSKLFDEWVEIINRFRETT